MKYINIYQKIYKKVYKNLVFSIYQNNLYVADNLGFIYSINLLNGKIEWIKNHSIPLKSDIKIYDNKIFLINQDNRIICFNAKDGTKIWDIRTISSFIKLQNFLSSAVSKQGDLIVMNSTGDLLKTKTNNGKIISSTNILKVLKKGKQNTVITGYIMGSGKIYSTTANGYLIVSSAVSGKVENFKKIGYPIASSPIINDGKLYILTKNSRILGFN